MPPPEIFKPARLSPQYGPARRWIVVITIRTPVIDLVPIDQFFFIPQRIIGCAARSAEEAAFLAAIILGCSYESTALEIVDVQPADATPAP